MTRKSASRRTRAIPARRHHRIAGLLDHAQDLTAASKLTCQAGALTPDVQTESGKLRWADALILQFPLWWFTMPAILKGWVDRVLACGFAYGVGEHSERRRGDRYGEDLLADRRAMLIVMAGGWPEHYAPRGINGSIDDLLFPIQHGILFCPRHTVLPRSWPTGSTGSTMAASRGWPDSCASGCVRWQRRRPCPIGGRTAGTI